MAAGDLTTVDKVRTQLAIDSAAADEILGQIVTASSAWFVQRIGRNVLSASYAQTYDGNGRTRLLLRQWPVTAVASLAIDGETIPAQPAVTEAGWVIAEDGIGLELVGYTFTKGTRNVAITYTAGYATVPADLEQAVIEHVALRYKDRGREGLSSVSGGGESIGFTATPGALAFIEGVVERYRVPGVA